MKKVLKRVPELARRLELEGTRVRYEILNPGRAYVRLMRAYEMASANQNQTSLLPKVPTTKEPA